MRRHWSVATALAATLLAGLLVAPAAPAAAAKYDMERRSYIVKTRAGDVYVEVVHPVKDGKIVTGPAVFTYSPYWMLGATENFRRATDAADWVPDGYHRVWADVVGTGNSGGCWDYGGNREKKSGHDLVEWIAKQKWSTGKVGMFGGSYEGTTATATAVTKPKHLTTIVPEAAISRWYGYAYSGGMRYFLNNEKPDNEGFDTPLLFDAGIAVPPPLDVDGENWAGRFQENVTPCDEVSHIEHGYDDTPDYDKFWVERDYLRDAGKIDIPVMVAHNWGDYNVKQEEGWNLYHALKNAPKRVLYMGDRYMGHGTPDEKYEKVRRQWMDHYLMGIDNGIDNLPSIISEGANFDKELKYESDPKAFKTRNVRLFGQSTGRANANDYEYKLLPSKPFKTSFTEDPRYLAAGVNLESHANHHYMSNHEWTWLQTQPLKKDTRIFGEIKLKVRVSAPEREWITITPSLVDVKPACHEMVQGNHVSKPECMPRTLYGVTRGFLDSRYRKSLAKQSTVPGGSPIDMTVVHKPVDYTFKKGHLIGLNIQSELNEWVLSKPYPCTSEACLNVTVHLMDGKTQLFLPIVNGPRNPRDLFVTGGHHH